MIVLFSCTINSYGEWKIVRYSRSLLLLQWHYSHEVNPVRMGTECIWLSALSACSGHLFAIVWVVRVCFDWDQSFISRPTSLHHWLQSDMPVCFPSTLSSYVLGGLRSRCRSLSAFHTMLMTLSNSLAINYMTDRDEVCSSGGGLDRHLVQGKPEACRFKGQLKSEESLTWIHQICLLLSPHSEQPCHCLFATSCPLYLPSLSPTRPVRRFTFLPKLFSGLSVQRTSTWRRLIKAAGQPDWSICVPHE